MDLYISVYHEYFELSLGKHFLSNENGNDYRKRKYLIFYFLLQNRDCGYSLEPPH